MLANLFSEVLDNTAATVLRALTEAAAAARAREQYYLARIRALEERLNGVNQEHLRNEEKYMDQGSDLAAQLVAVSTANWATTAEILSKVPVQALISAGYAGIPDLPIPPYPQGSLVPYALTPSDERRTHSTAAVPAASAAAPAVESTMAREDNLHVTPSLPPSLPLFTVDTLGEPMMEPASRRLVDYPNTGDDEKDSDEEEDDPSCHRSTAGNICDKLERAYEDLRKHPLVRHHDTTVGSLRSFEQMLDQTLPRSPFEHTIATAVRRLARGKARHDLWTTFMFKARQRAFSLYTDGRTLAVTLGIENVVSICNRKDIFYQVSLLMPRNNGTRRSSQIIHPQPRAMVIAPRNGRPLQITLARHASVPIGCVSTVSVAGDSNKKRKLSVQE